MSNYTLTYEEGVAGWVSFYSFYPDWMIGLNNYFYTFKGGNLYRHNVNNNRNIFYQDWWTRLGNPSGAFTPSKVESVINDAVLENKLFKTIDIQGDSAWSMTLSTDLQNSGFINSNWFERKEATFFAFIRNNSSGELSLRSVNGIGNSLIVTSGGTLRFITFDIFIDIGNIVSVGDLLYFGTNPSLAGEILFITQNIRQGVNQIVIETAIPGTVPIPTQTEYFLYAKNSIAESHGVLGHYLRFVMENGSSSKIELFSLESDVMKSFP